MEMSNPALPGEPTSIYVGDLSTLNVTLCNGTGGDIALSINANLEIFMPQYFTPPQLQQMTVIDISQNGWSFSNTGGSLLLSWQSASGVWPSDNELNFSIATILGTANPNTDSVQINCNNLGGSNIPAQISAALVLVAKPVPGNADLRTVLAVSSTYGGVVYVSNADNPLANTLYLNLGNISATPLYHGVNMWTGTPKIMVSFVYGSTSGALAPDNNQQSTQTGSAWGISGGIEVDQTGGWTVKNPSVSGQANAPSWTLAPITGNKQIVGTGDQSNVTFSFSNVISMTPIGPTQIYVQFSGFMANDNTAYNDTVFVVPINKQNPPNPGAIGIYCLAETIPVSGGTQSIAIPLTWSMFGVGSVKLSFYIAGMTIPETKYTYSSAHLALAYDTQSPQITGITTSKILEVYCWAYSDSNCQNLLNKIECSVPLSFLPIINSFSIATATITEPASYAFQLQWDIAGADSFEIVADDGSGNPKVLPIPRNVSSYVDTPTAIQTIYTLTVTGNSSSKGLTTMPSTTNLETTTVSAQVTAIITMPVGTVISYVGAAVPNGWLLCDGSSIDPNSYPNLFPLVVNGKLPDLRSCFLVGAGQGSGLSNYALNSTGGAETVTLSTAQIPSHSHTIYNGNFGLHHRSFDGEDDNDIPFETNPDTRLGGTDAAGGGQAHENRPPYHALNYIIKY